MVELDEIDSTNAEAARRAQDGRLGPTWIWAKSQSSGRGRQGRPWVSEPGNLYCSALLSDGLELRSLTQLGFVAGLAVYDAARRSLAPAPADLSLKWPNDLLLNGAKLSGILLESTNVPHLGLAVAVGIGVNVAHSPPRSATAYETTHLSAHGKAADLRHTFEHLARAFAEWHEVWDFGAGFVRVRDTWMDRAQGLGKTVTVKMPDQKLTGRFDRLDDDGAMIMRLENGQDRRILVGDLFVPTSSQTTSNAMER